MGMSRTIRLANASEIDMGFAVGVLHHFCIVSIIRWYSSINRNGSTNGPEFSQPSINVFLGEPELLSFVPIDIASRTTPGLRWLKFVVD
jgi:hypothetical protein